MTPVRCVCGAKTKAWYDDYYGGYHVECSISGCWSGPSRRTERGAIAAWNAVMIPAVTAKVQARNLRKLGKK